MKGGVYQTGFELYACECGNDAEVIWHYINGVANKIHYYVRCKSCKTRIKDRAHPLDAVEEWNAKQAQQGREG